MIKSTSSNLSPTEFSQLIAAYKSQMEAHNARFTSFDYCYNYFQQARKEGRTKLLAEGPQLELSVLQLGFYLASWGMYRGSTALLQHSSKVLIPVIEAIATTPPAHWDADMLFKEGDTGASRLMGLYERIEKALQFNPSKSTGKKSYSQVPTVTLITKIMLGVWGNTPAFDSYFCKGYDRNIGIGKQENVCRQVTKTWQELCRDYSSNTEIFEVAEIRTKPFTEGGDTFPYPKAKLIDMAYFQRGMNRFKEQKAEPVKNAFIV